MNSIKDLLIVSVAPYFLEKDSVWFTQNLEKILQSAKTQAFFQDNTIFLKSGQKYNFSEFLRKLDEVGYERVFKVQDLGEFSQRGGIIEVFPVNRVEAVRLDFLGNKIESIQLLDIKIENEEKVYPPKFYEEKFRRAREILKKKLKSQKLFSDLKNLKSGDYLVHLDHGVARFSGIEDMQDISNKQQQYYVLNYAQNDKLFIPVGLERKLSRYVGFTDPVISRLGSITWQKTKRKVKEDVEKLAKELLELYSKKEVVLRRPYLLDEELESKLKEGFIYEETPDQLQAIEDIKRDLSQEKPMDRIICGDVGFGKTEIAMRTSLLAAINNYQTAIICPTTILTNQHFNNFKKRFSTLGGSPPKADAPSEHASGEEGNTLVRIAMLSRLQTKKDQKKTIKDVAEGKVDILIGTHRILSGDVEFKNLQLLIIDDEQRFGVKQKEKLRHKNPSLDILSLSATPIPRTIYLALSSFKNMSLMQTPPQGRIAISTKILPYNTLKIKDAINFELSRGGQVYFLHNRVETIERTKNELEKMLPEVSFEYIHGRIREKELIKIMDEFQKNKINVLVATTIIENGIDLPNVNTIIVEDASRLGLAQAYQIRGRVGRSHIKSFAYLFYPKKFERVVRAKTPPSMLRNKNNGLEGGVLPLFAERLKVLGRAKELGAGYQIAIKDLELRGAGNILGKEQSGSINKIGLNLYCQILSDAIEKMKKPGV
ncbi:MAG: helicase-related protein [Patescibacteria group bacterium]